jgi:hypothetical protein
MAALAYDVGMVLVEQRDQQNAADAASLAGARFLPGDTVTAQARAEAIAQANGFEDGVNSATVVIDFGSWSPGAAFSPGTGTAAIRVRITATRPSIFAGIIGRGGWEVGSRAVAINQDTTTGPFAMLALNPTACPGVRIEGSGTLNSNGNIQVNSSCSTGDQAFRVAGTGSLDLTGTGIGCNIVGGASFGGGVSHNDCRPPPAGALNTGVVALPDPYCPDGPSGPRPCLGLPTPIPPLPQPMQRWNPVTGLPWTPATTPPSGCPGSASPATAADPRLCQFGGSFAGQAWRLFPGYYPGGLDLGGSTTNPPTYILEPGVYYVGDGGFRVVNARMLSVNACDFSDPLMPVCEDQTDYPNVSGDLAGGGVLIVNSTHPSGATNPNKIVLQGGNSQVNLWPLVGADFPDYAEFDRFVIYQDRAVTLDVEIHGGGSHSFVRGIIYAPTAHVLVRGNTGTLTVDQVIASTFEARGNGGTINVAYDEDFLPDFRFAGLVE